MQLRRIWAAFSRSDYYRNILTLISGATLSQLLLIILTPILSRIYAPDAFGLYALFLTLINIGAVVATGRYEVAILLPKSEKDALHLFSGSMILAVLVSLLVAMVLPFTVPLLNQWAKQEWGIVLYLIPFALFLQALLNATTYLSNRHQHYRQLSVSRFAGSATTGLSSILLGLHRATAANLVSGKVLGLVVEVGYILRPLWKQWRQSWTSLRENIPRLLRQYQNFPKFSVPEALLNMSHKQIPIIALTAIFSLEAAGLFAMANNLLSKPIGIVSTAFSQVFFRQSTEEHYEKPGQLRRFFLRNVLLLLGLIILPVLIIFFWGPALFAVFLGKNWYEAGIMARWLIPYLAFNFIKTSFSSLVDTANKLRESALFELAYLISACLAFWFGRHAPSPIFGIQLYCLFGCLLSTLQIAWYYRLTEVKGGWKE